MIKVLPAGFVSYKGKYPSLDAKKKENATNAYSTPQYRGINYNGISLVSFRGSSYQDTLNENYFKLPSGAEPDIYQKQAASSIYKGNDVLVTAPTGTGKTAIAYYAISKNTTSEKLSEASSIINENLSNGKKTFYTTPLKALSNEKFRQLKELYGEENVGLLTGDVKTNADAPIVVMTTEIYRNMVLGENFKENTGRLSNVKTVIFDELHYLGDVDRGSVWEQSIILSDPKTQLLSLSATIGNNKEIANWMSKIRGTQTDLVDVPSEKRHVPLEFITVKVDAQPQSGNQSAKSGKSGKNKKANKFAKPQKNVDSPGKKAYFEMVDKLEQKDRLPAIFFVFSKQFSKLLLRDFTDEGRDLTTFKERQEIDHIIHKYVKDNDYLGEALNKKALYKGYAIHNSGLLPLQKQLIEELFQKKLLKVVIATETLSAGINMPARTTVISELRKPTSLSNADEKGDGKRELTPNEFHQMAGRAGRRGIDVQGYVYTMYTNETQRQKFDELIKAKPNEIRSNFDPSFSFITSYYGMTQDDAMIKKIISKSLAAYSEDPAISNSNQKRLYNVFVSRRNFLQQQGFMNPDNTLTLKGEALSKLSGYEQIPLINAIFNQSLAHLDADELAGAVGMLANIDEKYEKPNNNDKHGKNKNEIKDYYSLEDRSVPLGYFAKQTDKMIKDYNKIMQSTATKNIDVDTDINVGLHLFTWANLNARFSDPDANWKELYRGDLYKTIKFEGRLYREIMQTIDLLKQIGKITEFVAEKSDDPKQIEYFSKLNKTAKEALKLIDVGVTTTEE